MRRLLVAGELCVDIIIGLPDEQPLRFGQHEQLVPSTRLTMGSSSAITACGAALAGIPTTMLGVVGEDDFGSFVLAALRGRGIDVSRIRTSVDTPTGSSVHLTRPGGDRAILTTMGTIGLTSASDVPESLLDRTSHLHVGSYFLQRGLREDAAALFSLARQRGASTSLDGNFDPSERWDSGILDVLGHTDVFFGNDQELTGITGASDPDDACERLLDRMPAGAVVVHKLGADGAIAALRRQSGTHRVRARVPELAGSLVDTVGAGDSLAAGFLAGRLSGAGVDRALALGVAAGSASTLGAGGVDAQPTRAEAEAIADRVELRRD